MTEPQGRYAAGMHRSIPALEALLAARRGVLRVRYSHQPNALASLAVLSACAAAALTGLRRQAPVKCLVTWMSVDYDGADDEQLLRVRLPRCRPGLSTRMSPVLNRRRMGKRLAASIPAGAMRFRLAEVEQEAVHSALALRHHLARQGWAVTGRRTCRSRVAEGFAALRHLLGSRARLPDALAEHNAWMIRQIFGVDVSVASGVETLLNQAQARQRMLSFIALARPDLVREGIWRVCSRCHVRTRVRCRFEASGAEIDAAECAGCGQATAGAALDLSAVVDSSAGPCPEFIVPVRLDDLLERLVEPDFGLAAHYPGSVPHLTGSRSILVALLKSELRGYPEPPPDWCPTHLDLAALTDMLLPGPIPERSANSAGMTASQVLYRSSALVAWSVLAGFTRPAGVDHSTQRAGSVR